MYLGKTAPLTTNIFHVFSASDALLVARMPQYYSSGSVTYYVGKPSNFTNGTRVTNRYINFGQQASAISIKSDPGNQRLIFIDSKSQSIQKLANFSPSSTYNYNRNYVSSVHLGISNTVNARLAYDWLTGNVYWTDDQFNWIAMQNVNSNDSSSFRVLIHEGVISPACIAIDPMNSKRYVRNFISKDYVFFTH